MRVLWISKASVTASYRKKLAWLADLGVELAVVTGESWGPWRFESAVSDNRYTIFRLPQPLSGRNHFHWYQRLGRIVDEFQPDVLHIDEEHYSLVTYQAARIAQARRIPFLFQTWQNILKRYPLPFSAMERYVFGGARAAVAGTEEIRDVLTRQGFAKPIHVVPLGVDTDLFYPDRQPAYRRHYDVEHRFAVGYIGRLVPEKGVLDLARALVPHLLKNPHWVWVIAGSGPLAAVLRERVAPVKDQVRMLAWQSSDEMARLMNALDVLAVPSRTTPHWKEQFGRVLIEAMAEELPVVAYRSGAIPEVVGDAGLLVPEGDIAALADAISVLDSSPPLSTQLREAGRARVLAHFSQERVARLISSVYQTI